jgi:hypothetical protein
MWLIVLRGCLIIAAGLVLKRLHLEMCGTMSDLIRD